MYIFDMLVLTKYKNIRDKRQITTSVWWVCSLFSHKHVVGLKTVKTASHTNIPD